MQVSHITLTFSQVFSMFSFTLTHHVVPGRNDEFLLLVMSGSALLIVMLCSRNRSSCITERRRTTAISFVSKVRTSRCWIFLSFSVSWFFSAWMSGVAVTGCLGSRVLITCSQKKTLLTPPIYALCQTVSDVISYAIHSYSLSKPWIYEGKIWIHPCSFPWKMVNGAGSQNVPSSSAWRQHWGAHRQQINFFLAPVHHVMSQLQFGHYVKLAVQPGALLGGLNQTWHQHYPQCNPSANISVLMYMCYLPVAANEILAPSRDEEWATQVWAVHIFLTPYPQIFFKLFGTNWCQLKLYHLKQLIRCGPVLSGDPKGFIQAVVLTNTCTQTL